MKTKIHLLPLLSGIASVVWIGMAIQRGWMKYPDTSQLVLSCLIGIMFLTGSITYNWIKNIENNILEINEILPHPKGWGI